MISDRNKKTKGKNPQGNILTNSAVQKHLAATKEKAESTWGMNASAGAKKINYVNKSPQKKEVYSFDRKNPAQMNLAEYTAWVNHTKSAYAIEQLPSLVDTRGSQYWNPYLGGRTTVPAEIVNHFRDNYGYEGPFDERFIEEFKPFEQFLETSDISWTASKPSAKDPIEKWTGYYYNKIASWQAEDAATRTQWNEYRNALQTYYDEFKDVTGRAPSIDEFIAAVDINDYSKLATINESLTNRDSTIQILNTGTYYSPYAVYGLYHALSQGQDISVDRDYFQDAVSYYMSPISTAQELKKYSWSGADFTKMSPEDYTTIEHGIINSGDMEELAALRFTRNAAYQDPEDVQIALLVNEAYGYNHDDAWFERALAAAQPYLDVSYDINGVPTYTKPSSKDSVGKQMAWYIYQESLKREDTAAVEEEWEKVTKLVNNFAAANREDFEMSAEGLDEFTTFIMDEIFGSEEASGLKISTLESYLKGKKDLCRITFASEDNLKAMIARAFTGEEVDAQTNYLVDVPVGENVEEDPVVEEAELPPLYDELQMQEGIETVKEYNTGLEAIKTAVTNLSNSGANISFSDVDGSGIATIPERIKNNAYLSGIFGNLWHEFKKADYVEKLGEDYALNQATASDPILKLLGSDKVDSPVTVRDLNALMDEMQFSSGSGEVSLADGVLAFVLPNAEGFQRHINSLRGRYGFQKTLHMLNSEIDVTAYRNAYNRAMEEGLSSDESTAIAFFAATDIAPAVKEQGMQYATVEAQSAFNSVMQAAMSEEGSSDVLAMAEHVASDVAAIDAEGDFDEIPAAEPVPLGSFLIPMIIGASNKASEGFAALTKDVMHDIATGDITPEDISKGVQMAIASGEKTPNQIQEEVERAAEPKKYALSPELERSLPRVKASEATKGMTDVAAKIGELSAANTPEQKAKNKKALELSDTKKWLEMSDADAHLAVAQAFGYESSPMFSAMSTMEAYGQYFSENEVREIYTAFQNGEISAEQIVDIVDDRISNQSPAVLSASRKPEELTENVLAARTYIENQKAGAAVIKPYSNEQLDVLSSVVDMVEQLGVYSYDYLTNATAKDYKDITGVDLVESGVIDEDIPLAELMDNMVGASWREPFKNEGVGLIEATTETGESIARWATSLPYLAGKVMDVGMDKVAEFFGIKDAWDAWNGTSSQMADVYDEIQKGEKGSELRMQEHAKAHEQLAKEAAVGATKILFSSGVGRWLSGIADASNGVMTTQKLLTLAGQSYDFASLIARTPYAAITGSEEFISNAESGMNLLNSAGRAAISMMIEGVTESPAVDDLLSFKLGSKTLKQGALDGTKKLDSYKNMLLMNFANGIYHELGEEELGIVIDRFITSAGLAAGLEHTVGEAFSAGFEGIGEEAKATALSTALTTIFLNAADMPSSSASYKYLQSMLQKGEATAMDVDIITAMMLEELGSSRIDVANQETAVETKAPSAPEEDELEEKMTEFLSQIENGEKPSTDLLREIENLSKQTRAPGVSGDLDDVEATTEPLEPESVELTPDVNTFDNAHDDMPPQVSQEAAKNEEPVETDEETTIEEPAKEEEIQASPGAQKIAEFITTSELEVSKALAKDHNQKIVEEMLANDPGIQSKQEELQTVEEEIQALNEKASQHQAEADNATNRQRQAIAAAVSNGLDTNSPQVLNAKFSTSQARDAALKELEKVEEDLKKADGRKTHIERTIDKLREGIELSKNEYADLDLFMRAPANQAATDNDKAKNAVPSAVGAEMTSSDVQKRKADTKTLQAAMVDGYSTGDGMSVEDYTDPGNYPVQDRQKDPDAWKPTKAEQETKNREDEKHIKLNKDFDEELSDNGWVEVNSTTYQNIVDQLKERRGYVDPSLARPKYDNGSMASGVAYVDGIPMDVYGVNGTREDGKTDTGEKYAHITESDQYLIVAKIDNDAPQTKEDLERYKGLTEASGDGDTGLERMRKSVATLSEQLESAQNRKAKLELEIARYKEDLADGKTSLTKKYAKAEEDLKTCKATIRTRQNELAAASKRLDDAVFFVTEFASKVNEDTGIDLEFDEDNPEYHANTRDAIEDQKRRNREYIVIDKTAERTAEEREFEAISYATEMLEAVDGDIDTLIKLYIKEKYYDRGRKLPKSIDSYAGRDEDGRDLPVDLVHFYTQDMDYEDLYAELYDMYYNRVISADEAFANVSQTLVGNKALENFVKQNGGFKNEDGTEGSFTPRGTRTYQVRSDVYNAYLEGSGWMSLKDDPQAGYSYRESMQAKIDLYAQERGLTLEERNDLYASHLLNTKDEDGFETVGDNESGVLKVKREFGDSLDTNSAIRDFNGEFNIAKAKEEVEAAVMYLDETLAGLHSIDNESMEKQLAKHALWVELLEEDGSIVKRRYGQPFIGKDGRTRRFVQPAQWLIDNALRIDLNRYRNNKAVGEDGTRLNFRIEKPQLNKKTERSYDVDAVHKDTAYLRPESQLEDELAAAQKHFEDLLKSTAYMATTAENQQYAAYTYMAAYANLIENKILALSRRWQTNVRQDSRGSMIATMWDLKQRAKAAYDLMHQIADGMKSGADVVSAKIGGKIEQRLNDFLGKNRTNEEMWVAAAVNEGKPLLKELQDHHNTLKARYEKLKKMENPADYLKAEMATLAAVMKTINHKIDLMTEAGVTLDGYIPGNEVQPAAKDNNVPSKPAVPIDVNARLDARVKDKSLDEQVKLYSKMRDYTKRRVAAGKSTVYSEVDFDKRINDTLATEETPESASQNLQLFGRSRISDIFNGIDQQLESTINPIKDEVEQPYETWEDSTWRNKVKNSADKQMVKDFEDGVQSISTMDEYNAAKKRIIKSEQQLSALQKQIDEHPTDTDEDKAAKQQLIDQRSELRAAKDSDVRLVMASEFVDNVTSRESGVNPPVDVQNPTEMEKGKQAGSAKYRFNKAKKALTTLGTFLKMRFGGEALGDGTLYTTKQLADALSFALDAEAMAEDNVVARQIASQKNKAKRRRAYLKFWQAYLRSFDADTNDGMRAARAEFKQVLMELDDPRGYTDAEVKERIKNEKEADATIDKLLRELYNAYHSATRPQMDAEIDGFQQMIDIIDATLERADRISSNLFKTSTADIERSLNHETGGHFARQIIDVAAQIVINASEKTANPKKIGARAFDSPRRAIEKFLGKSSGIFNSIYMDPIRKANAEITRRTDDVKRRVTELNLSKYAREKITLAMDRGLTDAEIRSEYGSHADEIIEGRKVIKGILNEIYSDIDAAFRRNGLEPPKWRKGYVPHIQKATGLAALAGMKTTWDDIPTELFGKTAEFKNTHQWAASLMARQGDSLNGCLTDIVEIVDTYTRSMLPVALYTDSVIALRDLEQVLREDMKYDEEGSVSKDTAARMGVFVNYLGDLANQIAGKKATHSADRWLENTMGGRVASNVLQKLKTQSGLAATAANVNVVTANFLPLTVAFAESPVNTIKGIQRALTRSVDFRSSDFLQARKGSEKMEMDTGSKLIDAMYKPAQVVDNFVSASIWETQYENCLQRGMTPEQARINADDRTARIMGSKQRGDMPMAYSSVIGSTVLQFTQESVNTISYMAHDMKNFSMSGAKSVVGGAAKYLAALLAFFLQGYAFNELTGRSTAPDVIGSVKDAIENKGEDDNAAKVVGQILLNMSDSLNPVDSLTDAFTEGGSIMDLSPLTSNIASTWDNVRNAASLDDFETFASNVAGAVLNWTPGGTTIERAAKTVDASKKGYVESAAGRIKHTFSADPWNVAMASLLGMNSSREGREYVSGGYRTLSDTKTASMKRLMDDYGLSSEDAYRIVSSETDEYNANKAAGAAEKKGEDPAQHEAAAADARSNISVPSDVASWAKGDTEAEWFKKGVQMWQESGLDVYPKDLNIEEGTMSPEDIEAANAYYRKQYKYIVSGWEGSAKGLVKELEAARKRTKAKYAGGEW